MCGIVGYTGSHQASPILMAGLRRLEYRGYDSAGVATLDDGRLVVRKKAGRVRTLEEALEGCLEDLDGFYTFAVGTADGFAVLRDPIACKPAVMAETDDWVAIASEYARSTIPSSVTVVPITPQQTRVTGSVSVTWSSLCVPGRPAGGGGPVVIRHVVLTPEKVPFSYRVAGPSRAARCRPETAGRRHRRRPASVPC